MGPEDIKIALREVLRDELPRILAELLPVPPEGLLDVDGAARRLGLAVATVYKRAQRCELPSVKLGERVLFRPADLDAYAEARRRSPERVRDLAKGADRDRG